MDVGGEIVRLFASVDDGNPFEFEGLYGRMLSGVTCSPLVQVAPLSDASRVEDLKWRSVTARYWLLVCLVLFDLVTKVIAAAFLQESVPLGDAAYLQLVLVYNDLGLGSWAQALGTSSELELTAASGVGFLAIGGSLILFQRIDWSRGRKILAGLVGYSTAFVLVRVSLAALDPLPPIGLVSISRTGVCVFWVCLWWISRPGAWRLAATLMAASALGNLLCLIPPPHRIVDFMYSTFAVKVLRLGVFNFADVYFDTALLCIAFIAGRALLRRVRRCSG